MDLIYFVVGGHLRTIIFHACTVVVGPMVHTKFSGVWYWIFMNYKTFQAIVFDVLPSQISIANIN